MIGALLPVIGPLLGDVIKRVLPADKDKAQEILDAHPNATNARLFLIGTEISL